MLFDNPEFIRLTRSKLRTRTMLLYGIGAFAVLTLILALMRESNGPYMEPFFFTVIGLQMAVLAMMGLSQAAQNIAQEREKNTLDFQRMVAMGPWRLASGKLAGCACEAWWIVIVSLPFAVLGVLSQDVRSLTLLQCEIVVASFGLFATSLGLAMSTTAEKSSGATATAVVMGIIFSQFIAITAVAGSLNALNPISVLRELARPQGQMTGVQLLGVHLPASVVFAAFYVAGAFFFLTATARRLADPELSFIKPVHAAIAFIVTQIAILLAMSSCLTATHALTLLHAVNSMLLIVLAFSLTPSAELLHARVLRGGRDEHWRILWERTNRLQDAPPMTAVAYFIGAYLAVSAGMVLFWGEMDQWIVACAVMVAATALAMAALIVWLSLYVEKGALKAAAGVFLGALAIPPILVAIGTNISAAIQVEATFYINPVAYLGNFAQHHRPNGTPPDFGVVWTFPIICVVAAVLLTLLAAMRIRFLLDMEHRKRAE